MENMCYREWIQLMSVAFPSMRQANLQPLTELYLLSQETSLGSVLLPSKGWFHPPAHCCRRSSERCLNPSLARTPVQVQHPGPSTSPQKLPSQNSNLLPSLCFDVHLSASECMFFSSSYLLLTHFIAIPYVSSLIFPNWP